MNSSKVKTKKDYGLWVKYFIFNIILFGAIFALQMNGGENVKAVTTSEYTVHQSNRSGNKNNYNAVGKDDSYFDKWYIQGTGIAMADVVTMTLKTPYRTINGIVAFETGYTTAGNKNYDSYKKGKDGVWRSLPTTGYNGTTVLGLAPGRVVTSADADYATLCTNFAVNAARSTQLDANGGDYYSLMCIEEDEDADITIKYAYTIRNEGYGQKEVIFALYNDSAYDNTPDEDTLNDLMYAEKIDVTFISSKPISEFNNEFSGDVGFSWITTAGGACDQGRSESGRPETDDICVEYTNSANGSANGKTKEPTTMKVILPKEVAYEHDASILKKNAGGTCDAAGTGDICISSIKDNTIYARNEFTNVGSSAEKYVRYYYHNFILTDGGYKTSGADFNADTYNNKINPEQSYYIKIEIDALGTYTFTITDIFGNVFTTFDASASIPHVKGNLQVVVNDVSITEIMVDYTNEAFLTLMEAEGNYPDGGDWRQGWEFSITGSESGEVYKVDFSKIQADSVDVVAYIFQKIVIQNGVYAKNGTDGADTDANIEDIAKEPLEFSDGTTPANYNQFLISGIQVWRVDASKTDDKTPTTAVTCGATPGSWTGNEQSICINLDASNFSVGKYSGYDHPTDNTKDILRKNKLVFNVKSNGKYRIKITDTYTNTTDSLVGEEARNPSVEVSVIDRTAPIITSELTGANNTSTGSNSYSASTSITSWEYVIGGGKLNPVSPLDPDAAKNLNALLNEEYWKDVNYYKTIYYNDGGTKIFNYQDALEIAKIKVVDQTYYYLGTDASTVYSYDVNFGYGAVNNNCLTYNGSTDSWAKEASVAGQYCDPSASLNSDRNDSGTPYNLHKYIIDNNVTSFSAGLVKQVGYTDYDGANPGNVYVKIDDNYSSARSVEFVNSKTASTFLGYLKIDFKTANGEKDICSVTIDGNDAGSTSNTANKSCFELMNKYIDEVENFRMVFTTEDYNVKKFDTATDAYTAVSTKHASNSYIVDVSVTDTTAPGIDMTGTDDATSIEYSNEETICRLEIDNDIQVKDIILNCYELTTVDGSNTTYNFRDNNVKHDASYTTAGDEGKTLANGVQYYTEADVTSPSYIPRSYHSKITLEIYEDGWMTVGDDASAAGFPHLYKSGYHKFRIRIYDHWNVQHKDETDGTTNLSQTGNVLTVYGTYYVNPRTLLIEPLANEKMYGENEPTFDYCVYVNKTNSTFNLEDKFFEVEFINEYFTYIYCTRDVYAKIENANRYKKVVGTESKGYAYNTYAQDNDGNYLKINNTYVQIKADGSNRYNLSMVKDSDGEFILVDGTYYEIKSGYVYTDDTCRFSVLDGSTDGKYLRTTSTGCVKIISSGTGENRYTEKYTQNNTGTYLKYNMNTVSAGGYDNVSGDAKAALVNNNEFAGSLARLESRCYNTYSSTANYHSNTSVTNFSTYLTCSENATNAIIRNDNVGQYHMVLGTLSIKEEIVGGNPTNYNKDYVIKINSNYVAKDANIQRAEGGNTITVKDGGVLVDDGLLTESTVNFTIRQAVLTISANGSSKYFGQQDPYSNKWNTKTTSVNNASTGYLGGYEVYGWRNNGNNEDSSVGVADASYIVEGVLRREVGEEVGIYDICNFNSNPATVSADSCKTTPDAPGLYDATNPYNFAAYDDYAIGGASTVAALTIRVNNDVYGNATGRKLNTTTRNYAISFIKADFKIEANTLVVQPGINQGKEYAGTPYNDPLWQLVVYGETINNASGNWTSNILKTTTANSFNGYTTDISVNTFTPADINSAPYNYEASGVTKDSEVYYSRRKTTPSNVVYQYVDYITIASVDKFVKEGDFYYKDNTNGTYIYAYGQYFEIVAANRYTVSKIQDNDGALLKVTVIGRLVNETYTLFDTNFEVERTAGNDVAWYSYKTIQNYKTVSGTKVYTLKKVANDSKECSITETSVATTTGAGVDCRNYNVVYRDNAPTAVKDADDKIIGYETVEGDTATLYKPDGTNACSDLNFYSSTCGAAKNILFEIFKREIILEFIDDNYTFIYGQRYDYYDGGTYASGTYSYNANTNGIFHVTENSEGDIFLCYSDLGDYLVDCTNNDDYGVTSGDTWDKIGLKFYLHSIVSDPANSRYYDTETSTHSAVPAGTYYVYAQIAQLTGADASKNTLINQNYKFTYKGGTLTIKPKVTNVQLTGYTMEYGETKYDSYGLGTNYSDYTSYQLAECMNDASYLKDNDGNIKTGLIADCGESYKHNNVGNTYGFVIEGLDSQDTIANNFNGRPVRDSKNVGNVGVHDDVGYYKISVGNIAVKKDPTSSGNASFRECSTNLTDGVVVFSGDLVNCVWWDVDDNPLTESINAKNYDITYSLANNEGAYLFIVPANLDIEVYENQTKMYGCAYSLYKTDSNYYYTYSYDDGYVNCDAATDKKVDLAYKYKVTGDKDADHSTYDVTTDQNGNRTFYNGASAFNNSKVVLTDDRLYRVEYNSDVTADYKYIKDNYSNYQGQAVGVYTISLGNLNVKSNSNATKCDAYNNPSLDGAQPCRNYNINYYGNSATSDINSHKYTEETTVNLSDLTLYKLKYTLDNTNGDYVLVDGKFVNLSSLKRYNADGITENSNGEYALIKKYVKISDLQTYDKLATYERSTTCGNDCYIYLDDSTKVNVSGNPISTGYVRLDTLHDYIYTNASGTTKSTSINYDNDYLQITKDGSTVYIKISTIAKFAHNSDAYKANTTGGAKGSGLYVFINNEYVQLNSLKKYKETSGLYTEDNAGTYVQIYEMSKISDLTKYSLDATSSNMYEIINRTDANISENLYVFINGSYVPYNSLITTAGQTSISVNSARKTDSGATVAGSVTGDVKFTITARIVYVHPEYNVKPYQEDDPVEYITCDEIKAAYGISNFTGRSDSYCGTGEDKIELGVSMYYAIQNSLAKAPWTAWTANSSLDTTESGRTTQNGTGYNDLQFDVLKGKVSRKFDATSASGPKTDKAGKYTYDFANVTTTGSLNGANYHIEYVTNKSLKNTYVKTGASSFATLHDLLFTTCNYGDAYCIPTGDATDNVNRVGKKIIDNTFKIKVDANGYAINTGTLTSISLVQKYSAADATRGIDYWYLGFYQNDESTGRNGEETKWWDNRSVFATPYDTFKNNPNNDAYKVTGTAPNTKNEFFTSEAKEVYFEIIKRTIYLYAVDVEKTYGEADKYSDFLIAICPNADGYIVDGQGVKCKRDDEVVGSAYGLGSYDKGIFVDANGAMKQWQIKNNNITTDSDYIFEGEAHQKTSFGIYFRRDNGENAGSYTITACATQTGVNDCTYEIPGDSASYYQTYIGDNYEIKEISGVLTIKTREIAITPDSDQGFDYGNYTDNGTMPNITFTEARDGASGENGLVYGSGIYVFEGTTQIAKIEKVQNASSKNTSLYKFTISTGDNAGTYIIDGRKVINDTTKNVVATINVTTDANKQNSKAFKIGSTNYEIVQKATCLINISGIYTVCINDAQNESLLNALGTNYFEYYTSSGSDSVYTAAALATVVYDGKSASEVTVSSNAKTYYSYNVYGDTYSNPANEYSNTRSETAAASASNVINALNIKCGSTEGLRYSREVCEYTIVSGEIEAGDVLIGAQTTFYIFVTKARRYSDSAGNTQDDDGNYVKYGNGLITEIKTDDMVSYICEKEAGTGKIVCEFKKDTSEGASNNYLKVVVNNNNYRVKSVDETVKLKVEDAEITVTPVEKQYKIYGEKDIEIKFTVKTEFTVARTHYQNFANSNIVKMCNNLVTPSVCYEGTDLNQFRYAANGGTTSSATGDYIMLTKGWTITLNSYAYDEEDATNKANNLDYGVNKAKNKHVAGAVSLTQETSASTIHYDKYTTYKASISTERILIGNLFVNDHDQTVGEKLIKSGLIVGVNSLGNKNYSLVVNETKLFVIVPRPVNVEIENITKIYGQATDKVSCDNAYSTECIVGEGILISGDDNNNTTYEPNEDDNESLLKYNYRILEKNLVDAVGSAAVGGVLTVSLDTANYTGVQVVYMSSATDYSKMNMPIATSTALASGDVYYNYATVVSGSYYTASGAQERKNATLNIQVERGEFNVARSTSSCLADISGELCEDVGEYYLSFAKGSTSIIKESTVANAYYDKYWGYNNNYYVVIYNNFEASGWSSFETADQGYKSISANDSIHYGAIIKEDGSAYEADKYADDANPSASATLKIRKRSVQIVVETISEYEYIQNNSGTHLRVGTSESNYKYHLITDTNRYNKTLDGKYAHNANGAYLCSYATANADGNCYEITSANRFNLKSKEVGEKFSIEQNMDVPALVTVNNNKTAHHTTYDTTNYESITWYHHPLQVRTGDILSGVVAYCGQPMTKDPDTGLDGLRDSINTTCSSSYKLHYYDSDINKEGKDNFFVTMVAGYYIITREKNRLYIKNSTMTSATGDQGAAYEANNYTTEFVNGLLEIDLDETPPVINIETDFIIKEANSSYMSGATIPDASNVLKFLNSLTTNGCALLTSTRNVTESGGVITNVPNTCESGIVFTYENGTNKDATGTSKPTVSYDDMMTLLRWFGLSSFDPGIMRAGQPVKGQDRYHARWYMAIQKDFNQQKTGDYTLFIYAQDDIGNISLASTVTLRIVDTTNPTVGTLNLYSAEVMCKTGENCSLEDNWVVKQDTYLPINALTKENLDAIKTADKATKYAFTGKDSNGKYTFAAHPFGTYYKITAGTNAKAVKHSGWINTESGVHLTITGGDDNSLTYLDTSGYTKYTVDETTITTDNTNGTHLLLGSFINVSNLTKYRQVKLTGENEPADGSGTTIRYMPDKAGTIIRYKGYYYNLTAITGLGVGYIGTAPSLDAYKLNLYAYNATTKVYTKVTDMPKEADIPANITYVIRDGEMYKIPDEKYDSTGKHSASGTYINIAQWDHYYSRDKGNSWIKYSRDTTSSYLALGQDGQRLIMIKAIDNGYTYDPTNVDKTHITDAYCLEVGSGTCAVWNKVKVEGVSIKDAGGNEISYQEFVGEKKWRYNISDWEDYNANGNRDRKYAYLDTIIPFTTLNDQFIEVFEYGCANVSKCSNNHVELFGKAIDGYLFKLSNLEKYNSSGVMTTNGDYVRINNELIKIEGSRRFNLSGSTITQSDSGDYIYLGKTDTEVAMDQLITEKVNSRLTSQTIKVYDNYTKGEVVITIATATVSEKESLAKLKENTNKLESGVGLGSVLADGVSPDLFSGTGNAEKTFGATIDGATVSAAEIADKYVTMFIYADIRGGAGGAGVVNNPYYQSQGYYKFVINPVVGSKYQILRCYSTAVIKENAWCEASSVGEFDTMKEAVEALLSVYEKTSPTDDKNKYNFNGNDITFTLDYRVFDIAGNASIYQRKGILFSGFTRTIGAVVNGGAAVAALNVEVAQNASISSILNNFEIDTTTGKNLRSSERILQSIYYNGELVSSRGAYDLSALDNLDTSVPGVYRIVYSIERKDGLKYVEGNSVELTITVKPTVANASIKALNTSTILIGISSILALASVVLFIELKKKQKHN